MLGREAADRATKSREVRRVQNKDNKQDEEPFWKSRNCTCMVKWEKRNAYWLFIDFILITHSEILIRSSGHSCFNRNRKTRERGRLHRKGRLQKTNNFYLAGASLRLSGSGLKEENRWTRHVILLTSGAIKCWVPSNYRKMSLLFNFSCCGINGPIIKLDFFDLSKVRWLRALFALNLKKRPQRMNWN